MVQYRSFRNDDPPALVEIWNESFSGRGVVQLRNPSALERFVFSKPFFDPAGLIVAVDANRPVGFAHAGFGPNEKETELSYDTGVLCMIGVRPENRKQGIGSELLTECERYLCAKGAKTLAAGPMRPLCPFYFALYGGSDMPGFLASEEAAAPFLEYHGYRPWDTCLVFQRRIDQNFSVPDPRFAALRRRFDLQVVPRLNVGSWWHEGVLGPLEPLEFRLVEIGSSRLAGRAEVWEMEGFSWRWGVPSAGVFDVKIRDDLRQQGVGKFLIAQLMKYLQDQYFCVVEMQVMERNQAAVRLCKSLAFEQVDFGRSYKKDAKAR